MTKNANRRQRAETVPVDQVNERIQALNAEGVTVLSISVERERGQMWLLTEAPDA